MEKQKVKKYSILFSAFFIQFAIGVLWFYFVERIGIIDSLYMVVITLSTVGFGEVSPLSQAGKIFIAFYIISGVGLLGYTFTSVASFIVEGGFKRALQGKKMEKEILKMGEHTIICGFGRIGKAIAGILAENKQKIVVINDVNVDSLDEFNHIIGDATEDSVLESAGIKNAKAIICCLSVDADNVFLTLTARTFNTKIRIISRAISHDSIKKLKRAGANEIVSMHDITAKRMATAVVKPKLVNMVNLITENSEVMFELNDIKVNKNKSLSGKTIAQLDFKKKTGALIIAIKQSNGNIIFSPDANYKIDITDILVTMGESDGIERLDELFE